MSESLRLDKWLWYARFFKTRSLATKMISGGKLRIDGVVVNKPHRAALVGQVLTFAQGPNIRVIKILALAQRRGPAPEAQALYEDLAPIVKPDKSDSPRMPDFEERDTGAGRPTKRDRRLVDKLKGS